MTECVSGTETYVKTKNGRDMMKCKCAECGITKTKFVSSQSAGNLGILSDVIKYSQKGAETLFPSTKPVKTKIGRNMIICKHAELGITKTKFVSNKSGSHPASRAFSCGTYALYREKALHESYRVLVEHAQRVA